jgi:hypothetical protein
MMLGRVCKSHTEGKKGQNELRELKRKDDAKRTD